MSVFQYERGLTTSHVKGDDREWEASSVVIPIHTTSASTPASRTTSTSASTASSRSSQTALYAGTGLTLYGLYQFNTKDAGITQFIRDLWHGPKRLMACARGAAAETGGYLATLPDISITVANYQPESGPVLQRRINQYVTQSADLDVLKEISTSAFHRVFWSKPILKKLALPERPAGG
ncbi:hypothetical protein DFJ73DRAFT_949682 [Zopfochytrium polystomum]|nr:hypothetical protein DFJ73DRAFT_949682 [Zopfochytrium polystomum]